MRAKFIGQVRGYSIDDNGDVHLTVEDTEISDSAQRYVRELRHNFNPQSKVHGFGANEVPCHIQPGMASYYFTVKRDDCKNVTFGSTVEVELDIFRINKVKFYNKRWGGIPELRTEMISIRPYADQRQGAKVGDNKDK